VSAIDRSRPPSMSAIPATAKEEKAKLRRELRRLDVVLFLMSAMVVVDTVGAIAIGGAQAFTWLVVLFVTFFIPSALVSAELGSAIPEEGGAYVWVRMAFGRFAGTLTSWLYWAGTPMWLGGSVTVVAIAVFGRSFAPLPGPWQYAFGAVFIATATLAAVSPLRFGKWVPSSGATGQIVLLGVFTMSVVLYGFEHGVHGLRLADFTPTRAAFIAVVPVLLYGFVGVELPSTAGEEMVDPRRDVPRAIGLAGLGQALMYGVPLLAVLIVLPAGQVTSLHGLIDAMRSVFTVYGGTVAADGTAQLAGAGAVLAAIVGALFIWVLLASGSAWIMGAGRAQVAACLDGGGPAFLGRISPRTGVPVIMGLVSGGVSLATMAADLWITRGDGERYFSAALTVSIALIVLAYLLIFPAFVRLRYRLPGLDRPFRAPGGPAGAWAIAGLATAWSALAAICLLWPGFGTAHPNAALPGGFGGQRTLFELMTVMPVLAIGVLALGFHLMGTRRRSTASAAGAGP
jgi:amino acid transporter